MAFYKEDIVSIELQNGTIFRSFMNHAIGSGDALENRFGVRVFRNGEPEDIGGTVMGLFVRADGGTVTIASGTVSGNEAYITLPEACYAVEGNFSLAIKCVGSGVTGTLRIVDGVVSRTSTDAVVDPGTIIPSVEALIDAIDDAVASIPADYSSLWTSLAPNYSTSNTYAVGQYVTYDGGLYRCTTAITSGESWTAAHWTAAKVGPDITDVRRIESTSPNLFNKNSSDIQLNKYITSGGWNTSTNLGKYAATHPIYVVKGETYKYRHFPLVYGNSNGWGIVVKYPGDLSLIGGNNSTIVTENNIQYCEWTAGRTGYACFNFDPNYTDSFMVCKKSEYPSFYCPFGTSKAFNDYPNSILAFDDYGNAEKAVIAFKSPNLFNKNSSEINTTRYANTGGWTSSGSNPRLGATHPIFCEAGKTYKWTSKYKAIYGANAPYAYRLNGSGNIDNVSNVGTESGGYYTVTINSSAFYVFDINIQEIDTFMFCEADKYPNFYAGYGMVYFNNQVGFDNVSLKEYPLAGKVLVCDGDSIAAATPDDPQGLGGWFGRLQLDEHITGTNYAVGGGSITYLSDSRHCISRDIDTIHNTYADLDYLILDGGTNDADLIGQFSGDTPPEGFGTWTATDFSGSYDDTTFCGAVESMFYKAVNYWPHAHIGFIIAMEMGTNNDTAANRKRYFDEIVKIATKWHIPVLNLWDNSGADARLTAFYDSSMSIAENVAAEKFYRDGQHPSSYGYNKMQPMIEAWVKSI